MPTFNLDDYVTVDERITKFWADHPIPEGSIQTDVAWVTENGASVAIKATVYVGERLVATGIAQEERGNGGANKTSWWENAETSAIGRALANMDMSLSKRRPSRQEMEKVQRYEEMPATSRQPRQDAPRAREDADLIPHEWRGRLDFDSADPNANRPKGQEVPITPRQVPQDAPDPLTDAQQRVIAQAWELGEHATPYPAIILHLRQLQSDANPDQWTAIKRALAAIKAKHYQQETQA